MGSGPSGWLVLESEIGSSPTWLPKCNSMRTRPGRIEPEIYFRIIHGAIQGQQRNPMAAYCEQTVEIAHGPKRVFENGNIDAPTRRRAVWRAH